jgi:hypothetical protein
MQKKNQLKNLLAKKNTKIFKKYPNHGMHAGYRKRKILRQKIESSWEHAI